MGQNDMPILNMYYLISAAIIWAMFGINIFVLMSSFKKYIN